MKRKILVADDNRSFRMMLNLVLSEQYEVRTVDNGIALEQELLQGDYDLLLSDLNLPQKNASTVLRSYERMHEDDGFCPIPAIIVTGMEEDGDEVQSIRRLVNVKDVFQKPIEFKQLKERIDEILSDEYSAPICSQICRAVATLPRVLVVDNEPDIRQYMYAVLDAAGFQARTCASSAEAVRSCNRSAYDVILLDYVLEDCLADDVLAQLSQATQGTKMPAVLIVTGFEDTIDKSRFDKFPMVKGVMAKPFNPDALVKRVKALVGCAELYQAAAAV